MRVFLTLVAVLVLLTACQQRGLVRPDASRAPQPEAKAEQAVVPAEAGIHATTTTEVAAVLRASGKEIRVTGRISFHLTASETHLKDDTLLVPGFNVALFHVPQKVLAGSHEVKDELGFLGFAVDPRVPQTLRYDANSGRISGELKGYIDATYMSALLRKPMPDSKGDALETVTQPATLSVEIRIPEKLDPHMQRVDSSNGSLKLKLKAEAAKEDGHELAAFDLSLEPDETRLGIAIGPWRLLESGRNLCIQPVRIGRITVSRGWAPRLLVQFTGDGLGFGQPQANSQWRKADVVFTYRDWKTVWKPAFWLLGESEDRDLLDEVNDDDCIEVYFVDALESIARFGGGATFGSGTGSAKIITSDAVADGGVDFTHLAHELGHVMGLRHPGDAATSSSTPASTGTLLCPSGFLNDNPQRNSQENKDKLSNPLFTFILKLKSAGPDCIDSADCGACP